MTSNVSHCHECQKCIGADEAALLRHQLTFITRPGYKPGKMTPSGLFWGAERPPSALDDLSVAVDRLTDLVSDDMALYHAFHNVDRAAGTLKRIADTIPVCPSYEDGERCTKHMVEKYAGRPVTLATFPEESNG